MTGRLCPPMLFWAARDLGRRPWRSLASALTLFTLALLLGGSQLIHQALVETSARMLAQAPAIVVRRAGPTGWSPLPIEAALEAVRSVPGALTPHVRLWGLAQASGRTVTVIAPLTLPQDGPEGPPLGPGEVALGSGLASLATQGRLVFDLQPRRAYRVRRILSAELALAVHDTVLMHPEDARVLLGIPPAAASDLAIEVFHEEAVGALCRDLSGAFPWPVQISSRTEALGRSAAEAARATTLVSLTYTPALLALVVLALAGAVEGEQGRAQAGLLRSLGWTGKDFLRLSLWRWACLALPALGLGLAAAYFLIFTPGIRWPGPLLFGWTAPPPAYALSSAGSALVLAQVAALVALPYLAIVVATGLRHATGDPQELFTRERP